MTIDAPSSFSQADLLVLVQPLRAFARRFVSKEEDVDDLVQETLARALAHAAKFQRGTRLKSWLFTIMRNCFCTRYGIAKREVVGIEDDICDRAVTAPTQEWHIRGQELNRAFADLPSHQFTALHMVFIEGMSYDEAATRSNCAVGTIKSRVNRARLEIAKSLGET